MWAHISITTAFLFLHFISIATSNIVIQTHQKNNGGYRCNERIYTPETLEAAARDALIRYTMNARLSPEQTIYPYPEVYKGYLGINGEDGYSLLWPLIDSEPVLKLYGDPRQVFYVVLRRGSSNNLEPIGIVEKWNDKTYRKCVWERDISNMFGHPVVAGFRCPTKYFSLLVAEKAVKAMEAHTPKRAKATINIPVPSDRSSLFDFPGPLSVRPIGIDGRYFVGASSSIVYDTQMNLIGMVQLSGDTYQRCKVTSQNRIIPNFIQSTILPAPQKGKSGERDLFECGSNFIKPENALNDAAEALAAFRLKRQNKSNSFPKFFIENNHEKFYLWPATAGLIDINENKNKGVAPSLFLVITEFSDIVGIVRRRSNGRYRKCRRILMSSSTYRSYFEVQLALLERIGRFK